VINEEQQQGVIALSVIAKPEQKLQTVTHRVETQMLTIEQSILLSAVFSKIKQNQTENLL